MKLNFLGSEYDISSEELQAGIGLIPLLLGAQEYAIKAEKERAERDAEAALRQIERVEKERAAERERAHYEREFERERAKCEREVERQREAEFTLSEREREYAILRQDLSEQAQKQDIARLEETLRLARDMYQERLDSHVKIAKLEAELEASERQNDRLESSINAISDRAANLLQTIIDRDYTAAPAAARPAAAPAPAPAPTPSETAVETAPETAPIPDRDDSGRTVLRTGVNVPPEEYHYYQNIRPRQKDLLLRIWTWFSGPGAIINYPRLGYRDASGFMAANNVTPVTPLPIAPDLCKEIKFSGWDRMIESINTEFCLLLKEAEITLQADSCLEKEFYDKHVEGVKAYIASKILEYPEPSRAEVERDLIEAYDIGPFTTNRPALRELYLEGRKS